MTVIHQCRYRTTRAITGSSVTVVQDRTTPSSLDSAYIILYKLLIIQFFILFLRECIMRLAEHSGRIPVYKRRKVLTRTCTIIHVHVHVSESNLS